MQLADEGPCVILGRCGDYVLREHKDVLRVFIYAPVEWRQMCIRDRGFPAHWLWAGRGAYGPRRAGEGAGVSGGPVHRL